VHQEKQVIKKIEEPVKKESKRRTSAPSPKKAKTVKVVVKGNSASTSLTVVFPAEDVVVLAR
jgi:hypothetical protein